MIMGPTFFRIIEITFASYMVPALLVPLVWVAARIMKSRLRRDAPPALATRVRDAVDSQVALT